ncbi:MAG: rhodanese-like domain-containing protein [Pseudomonadota bacterium]
MDENSPTKRPHLPTRRFVLGLGAVGVAGGGLAATRWFNVFAATDAETDLSAEAAYQMALDAEIYLVDIRRPDEWQRTGIAEPAIALDMRRNDFEAELQLLFDKQGARPVALICARGVRSARLMVRLERSGFTQILDVPEGMIGSGAGTGYLAKALPLREPSVDELG